MSANRMSRLGKLLFSPSRPLTMAILLVLVLGVISYAMYHREKSRLSQHAEMELRQLAIAFDKNLLRISRELREIQMISGQVASLDQLESAMRQILRRNDALIDFRILTVDGQQVYRISRIRGAAQGEQTLTSRSVVDRSRIEYFQSLRQLSQDEIFLSGFYLLRNDLNDPVRPLTTVITMGMPLYFSNGSHAGYVLTDINADRFFAALSKLKGSDFESIHLLSSRGEWIYHPDLDDPWNHLLIDASAARRDSILDALWSHILKEEGGARQISGDIWTYRPHFVRTSLQHTVADGLPGVIEPTDTALGQRKPEVIYFAYRTGAATLWYHVLIVLLPFLLVLIFCISYLFPALQKRREKELENMAQLKDLEESRFRTQLALESGHISQWRINLRTDRVEADATMNKLLLEEDGFHIRKVEEWMDRVHPADQRKTQTEFNLIKERTEGWINLRHRLRRGDGTWGWFRFRGGLKRWDEAGADVYLYGTYIDLTDIVQREEEIQRLELATQQSNSGVVILDRDGRLEWSNLAFLRNTGYNRKEIKGKTYWSIVIQDDLHEKESEQIRVAIQQGRDFSVRLHRTYDNDQAAWVRIQGNPVLDAAGVPSHFVVVELDITREMNIHLELEKSEALLQESQKLAHIGSWEADCRESTFYWSDQLGEILGWKDATTDDLDQFFPAFVKDDQNKLRALFEKALQAGEGFQGNFRLQNDTGDAPKWAFIKCMAQREDGELQKIFGILQDVSETKNREEILREEREKVERINKRLNEVLQEARLNESRVLEAHEAKSRFLSTVSHEVRTPLSGLIGTTDLLRETNLSQQQKDYVDAIHQSGSALMEIINDILDYSKLEQGKFELDNQPFFIREMVEEVLKVMSGVAISKNVELIYGMDPDLPDQVVGDMVRVRQILFNLLGNAIKFTDEGTVSVRIELVERLPTDRCKLLFEVEDTGIGIPEDRMEHLFDSFSQVSPSISNKYGGTGLGLAICKELSKKMGGDISCQSTLGEGSLFQVQIPFSGSFTNESLKISSVPRRKVLLSIEPQLLCDEVTNWFTSLGWSPVVLERRNELPELLKDFEPTDWMIFYCSDSADLLSKYIVPCRLSPEAEERTLVFYDQLQDKMDKHGFVEMYKPILWSQIRDKIVATEMSTPTASIGKRRSGKSLRKESLPTGLKILVAEDNKVNQKVIRLVLKKMDVEVDIAVDGKEAVEKACNGDYSIILMDIQMPEMDGYEATRKIRERTGDSENPWIIALTAGTSRDAKSEALNAGMNGFLLKPLQKDDLLAALLEAVKSTRVNAVP